MPLLPLLLVGHPGPHPPHRPARPEDAPTPLGLPRAPDGPGCLPVSSLSALTASGGVQSGLFPRTPIPMRFRPFPPPARPAGAPPPTRAPRPVPPTPSPARTPSFVAGRRLWPAGAPPRTLVCRDGRSYPKANSCASDGDSTRYLRATPSCTDLATDLVRGSVLTSARPLHQLTCPRPPAGTCRTWASLGPESLAL